MRSKVQMFGFINRIDEVIWQLQRDSSADVSSISPLSEQGFTLKMSALESLSGGQITITGIKSVDGTKHSFLLLPMQQCNFFRN